VHTTSNPLNTSALTFGAFCKMTHVPLSMMGSVTMTLTTLATSPTSWAAPNTPMPVRGRSLVSVGTAFESVSWVPCSCQRASAARARDTTVLAAMKTLNADLSASPAFPSTDFELGCWCWCCRHPLLRTTMTARTKAAVFGELARRRPRGGSPEPLLVFRAGGRSRGSRRRVADGGKCSARF